MANAVAHPSAHWHPLGDGGVFYRRTPLYTLEPGALPPLDECIVAGARAGGPIALMRDTSKVVALGRPSQGPLLSKGQIAIFSSSGRQLLLLTWDNAKIVALGWTSDERLVLLNEEGAYRLYTLSGEYEQHTLGGDVGDVGVLDARVHGEGLVALTGALQLVEVRGWEGARAVSLASLQLDVPPTAWAVVPPDYTTSRHTEALIATDTTIWTVDSLDASDQRLGRGPFTHVACSPNGKSLALLNFGGLLWVVSADFQRSLAEFDTTTVNGGDGEDVRWVEWVGNDAVAVGWRTRVVVVGPFGEILEFTYSGPTYAISEPDGLRIISPDSSELIQKVPPASSSALRPGSTSPAAILLHAHAGFTGADKRPAGRADEDIRAIRPELAAAVDALVQAAGEEWEPVWQRKLLSAANFGKGFLDLYDPNDFVAMGRALKVLNAVRFYEIGIPITYVQYQHSSPQSLVSRLTSRSQHLLALRVSAHLGLPPDAVLKHWAAAKIAHARGPGADVDEEVCRSIVAKFEELGGGGVSYAEIARRAWEVGRSALATLLLDHEPRAADQVPLLLAMQEDGLALRKAVDSGDTDLVYHVLLQLYTRLPLGAFFKLIEDGGPRLQPASKLLQVYARAQNREMLRDFYFSDDRRVDSAVLSLDDALSLLPPPTLAPSSLTPPTQSINAAPAVESVKKAQKFFSEDRERGFEAKMMDDFARLLGVQEGVERELDGRVRIVGLSVSETIRACLVNGLAKRAESVRSGWKVPDKRFWYIKLHALTEIRDFEALETFAKSKRSPIGYEAFVRHLLDKGHPTQAATYVARCDAPRRVDLYVQCGDWRAAAKECKERGDKGRIEQLKRTAPNDLVAREIDAIASQMK
ncbi:vacuolar protein sorting-associated protein 16 [Peniophora sp. CONT]|nr:vacuolar protein sorting-associated protein 16 [Peniophora sp. CONT]